VEINVAWLIYSTLFTKMAAETKTKQKRN